MSGKIRFSCCNNDQEQENPSLTHVICKYCGVMYRIALKACPRVIDQYPHRHPLELPKTKVRIGNELVEIEAGTYQTAIDPFNVIDRQSGEVIIYVPDPNYPNGTLIGVIPADPPVESIKDE